MKPEQRIAILKSQMKRQREDLLDTIMDAYQKAGALILHDIPDEDLVPLLDLLSAAIEKYDEEGK